MGQCKVLKDLGERWASSVKQLFERVENPYILSLSELRRLIGAKNIDEEMRLRMEKEIEDTEFRLKRGSDLGRFDQFWDDCLLSNAGTLGRSGSISTNIQVYHLKSTRML